MGNSNSATEDVQIAREVCVRSETNFELAFDVLGCENYGVEMLEELTTKCFDLRRCGALEDGDFIRAHMTPVEGGHISEFWIQYHYFAEVRDYSIDGTRDRFDVNLVSVNNSMPEDVCWGEYCYGYIQKPRTWDNCEIICRYNKANSVTITTEAERDVVKHVIGFGGLNATAFLGFINYDLAEHADNPPNVSRYQWIDSSQEIDYSLVNWGPGEPSFDKVVKPSSYLLDRNETFIESVAEMNSDGVWNDVFRFIIRRPGICKVDRSWVESNRTAFSQYKMYYPLR